MIHVGDGTWNLRIFITDLQVEKTLRVRGDLHIGGLMLKLVDPGLFAYTLPKSLLHNQRSRNLFFYLFCIFFFGARLMKFCSSYSYVCIEFKMIACAKS